MLALDVPGDLAALEPLAHVQLPQRHRAVQRDAHDLADDGDIIFVEVLVTDPSDFEALLSPEDYEKFLEEEAGEGDEA